jgi:transcriptional regulator with XRE-family HTH domain
MVLIAKGSGVRGSDELTGGFGALLRIHRSSRRLTQEELASLSGLSVRAIADMERGRTARPYPSSVQLLADALELSSLERGQLERAARSAAGETERAPGQAEPTAPLRQAGLPPYLHGHAEEFSLLTSLVAAMVGTGGTLTISAGEADATGKPTLALHWSPRASDGLADGQLHVSARGTSPAGGRVSPAEAIRAVLGAVLGSASPACPETPTRPADADAACTTTGT